MTVRFPLGQSPLAAPVIELAGVWTLTEAPDGAPVPMTVPGDVHTALQAAGRIPEYRFTPHTPGDARLSLRGLRSATA